jgi:hypothetical protein
LPIGGEHCVHHFEVALDVALDHAVERAPDALALSAGNEFEQLVPFAGAVKLFEPCRTSSRSSRWMF